MSPARRSVPMAATATASGPRASASEQARLQARTTRVAASPKCRAAAADAAAASAEVSAPPGGRAAAASAPPAAAAARPLAYPARPGEDAAEPGEGRLDAVLCLPRDDDWDWPVACAWAARNTLYRVGGLASTRRSCCSRNVPSWSRKSAAHAGRNNGAKLSCPRGSVMNGRAKYAMNSAVWARLLPGPSKNALSVLIDAAASGGTSVPLWRL
mmetsp:Transcript_18051/g.68151  ORF Transcript_18051/g.68151 Transcript_18051/m.68151 type:complete len:213 (+) Transcript_18051:441-1079(+)